ncbi:MAG TPA: PLP-dependent aminotransferase family protein [Roseiflexaceae bacterium]|nr:PLP-dependent aminotransferase family protein [Roseiflexaceae bacterium]
MQIALNRASPQPLYAQLAQDIQRRIRSGALPPGARLPTVRELARQLGVTRLTIHSAYSELQAGGWVEATVGRGTFVAAQPEPTALLPEPARELSPRGILNDMLQMARLPGMRSLAMADAAPDLYPQREFARALEEALSSGTSALGYTAPQGDPLLRTTLADLLRERGISAGPDEIVVTSGVTQGMSLIAHTLARPGDSVIVEKPTYLGLLNILNVQGIRAIGAPMDDDGLVVGALEELILKHRPRFIYTIPVFQNPSGVCLSPARRAALLALIERYRVPLIEDDIYSQLVYEGAAPPALKADDQSELVLNIGSFSKSLLPGARVGYIVATPQTIGRLVGAKQADDLCSPPLLQRALALFIQHGWLSTHLRRVIPRYRERRDALMIAMARHFPSELRWTTPQGGFCSWVTLPSGASTIDLYLAGIERGVAFAPGDVFFAEPAPKPYIRLSFSSLPPELIGEAIQVLGQVFSSHLVRRSFAAPALSDCVPLV